MGAFEWNLEDENECGFSDGRCANSDNKFASYESPCHDSVQCVKRAISALENKLQGSGFDAETDVAAFEAIRDAIAALECAGNKALSGHFSALTSNYEAAISVCLSRLELKLQGDDIDEADFTTLADLAAAIVGLDTVGSTALSAQFMALSRNYEAPVALSISRLKSDIRGAGFAAGTGHATFEAISDAIAALESAGNTVLSNQFAALTTNYEKALSSAISGLEQILHEKKDVKVADFRTLAEIAAAIEALDTGDAARLSEQLTTVTVKYHKLSLRRLMR